MVPHVYLSVSLDLFDFIVLMVGRNWYILQIYGEHLKETSEEMVVVRNALGCCGMDACRTRG